MTHMAHLGRSHASLEPSRSLRRRQIGCCFLLGVAFAFAQSFIEHATVVISFELFCSFLSSGILFIGLFKLFNGIILNGSSDHPICARLSRYIFDDEHSFVGTAFRASGIVLICWLPYVFVMYPGNLSNNTTGQLTMFYTLMGHGERWITAQHPLFDTLIFGAITYPFYIRKHFRIGVFVCILLQEVLTAASVGVVFSSCHRRWGVRASLCFVLLGFVAFCPVFPLVVASLSKDTFFSWVYLVWLTLVFDVVLRNAVSVKDGLLIGVPSVLMCVTKKFGFYVVFLTLIAMLVHFATHRKSIGGRSSLAVTVGLTLLVSLTNWVGLPALEASLAASPAYKTDTLIVPIQQVAAVYDHYPDEFSNEEMDTLRRFIDTKRIDDGSWDRENTDTVKLYGDSNVPGGYTDAQVRDFIHLWLRAVARHPGTCFDGWAALEAPLFSFGKIVPLFDNHWHTWARASVIPDHSFEKAYPFDTLSASVQRWYTWLATVPGIDALLTQTLYAVLIPAYFLVTGGLRLRQRGWIAVIPVIVSFLGLLISPMVMPHFETMRYLVPFLYTAPLLLMYVQAVQLKLSVGESRNS